jgi:hypothetical protein
VVPHEIPVGVEVTVPVPLPALLTVSGTVTRLNRAVIVAAALTVTLQAPVPVHAPDQPANTELGPAVGTNWTTEPAGKLAVQVVPQSMPTGFEATVPVPVPARLKATVSG